MMCTKCHNCYTHKHEHCFLQAGEFGIVYRATLAVKDDKSIELVAVKTLKGTQFTVHHNMRLCSLLFYIIIGTFTRIELDALVEESLIMSQFDHQNVMRLIGVSIETDNTVYVVMPFMTNGSLLGYLRKHREDFTIKDENNTEEVLFDQQS